MNKRNIFVYAVFLVFIFSAVIFAAESSDHRISFTNAKNYTSNDLYVIHKKLVEDNPKLLELEILGYSYDHQPIYVIRFGEDLSNEEAYVNKMHGLIESGTHAREVANPVLTSKILEDYIKDYYDDHYIKDMNVKEVLKSSTFHFIINSNPDGFNITKFGKLGIKTKDGLANLLKVKDTNYSQYKSNARGVDLNRNYPDVYFNFKMGKWTNIWGVKLNYLNVNSPSGAYFRGKTPASEIETQIMMAYLLKYDFRFYLSFHSKGEVVYWNFWMLSPDALAYMKEYGQLATDLSGYQLMPYDYGESSSGYMGDFIVNNTLKPAITIETMPYTITLPNVSEKNLKNAYEDIYKIPYKYMKLALKKGYFKYRLYVNEKYVRDFREKVYADAHALKLGGIIIEDIGTPKQYYPERVSREDFLSSFMKYTISEDEIDLSETVMFEDTDNKYVNYAKSKGLISEGDHGNFYPNRSITYAQSAIILYNLDKELGIDVEHNDVEGEQFIYLEKIPIWAMYEVAYCVSNNYIKGTDDFNDYLSKQEFELLLEEYHTRNENMLLKLSAHD